MYKDKDRQREANKKAAQRYRDQKVVVMEHIKDMKAKGVTKGVTVSGSGAFVTPKLEAPKVTAFTKTKFGPKRGKDIKCFEDLPPDVQQTIKRISNSNEEFQRRTQIAIHYQHMTGRYEPISDQDFTRALAQAGPGHVRVSKPGDEDYEPQCETSRKFIEGGGLKSR